MRTSAPKKSPPRPAATIPPQAADHPSRPGWLNDLIAPSQPRPIQSPAPLALHHYDSPHYSLVRARVHGAASLDDAAFEHATVQAYNALVSLLQKSPASHIARFWNYIPDIHRRCGNGLDRYMVFNAGRFQACRNWLGDELNSHLPTASGVGLGGDDLVIDALALDVPGQSVENPRQISAYQYSRRYGPHPPCFARGVRLPPTPHHPPRLLIGGTASVRGEDSVHASDLTAQIGETLENLSALSHGGAFTDLRVYHPRPADRNAIAPAVRHWAGPAARIEFLTAELCRQELLVEIEGVATLPSLPTLESP